MVMSVTPAANGDVWLATFGGAIRIRNNEWRLFNEDNSGLAGNQVRVITVSGDGTVWFGTHGDGITTAQGLSCQ
jgi:ligand-binding sensor domain-containing protein